MNLCNKTLPKGYLLVVLNKSTSKLNFNDLGNGIARQTILLTYFDSTQHKYSHLTCSDHTKVSDGLVVSCGQKSNDSKFHVESASLNNKKTCQTKAFDVTAEFRQSKTKSMIVLTRAEPVKANDNNLICLTAKIN